MTTNDHIKKFKNVCIYIKHLNRSLKYYTLYDRCTKSLNVLKITLPRQCPYYKNIFEFLLNLG